jgi:cytochrome c-type biogenesis protein CcmH/NrfF
MTPIRRLPAAVVAATALCLVAAAPSQARQHASATAIEQQAMCVTCKIPLPEAQSPQATRERAFIKREVAAGLTEAQVKRAMVAEYGAAVLGLPSTHGFDLAVYIIPPLLVLVAVIALALTLPQWRRRAREAQREAAGGGGPTLSPADIARLDQDLARFDL